jgi:hypothetical protein
MLLMTYKPQPVPEVPCLCNRASCMNTEISMVEDDKTCAVRSTDLANHMVDKKTFARHVRFQSSTG